jgi:hypothetical protein
MAVVRNNAAGLPIGVLLYYNTVNGESGTPHTGEAKLAMPAE